MHTRTQEDSEPIVTALDRLDDEVAGYGRAIETAVAARAAGCTVPSSRAEGAELGRRAGALADQAVTATGRDHDRARALRKVAGHLHALDVELADPAPGAQALEVVAKALAAALDVFARPDIQGLARLQDRVDLLLDHVEHHSGLRRAAVHLLGIGTAAEFAFENHPHRRWAELVS
jgi:hypothetical protein